MPSSLVTRAARGEVKKPATARTPAENMRYGGSFGQALWGKVSILGAKWARLGSDGRILRARVRIRLGGVFGYGENLELGEIEILKILILTKTRERGLRAGRPRSQVDKPTPASP